MSSEELVARVQAALTRCIQEIAEAQVDASKGVQEAIVRAYQRDVEKLEPLIAETRAVANEVRRLRRI